LPDPGIHLHGLLEGVVVAGDDATQLPVFLYQIHEAVDHFFRFYFLEKRKEHSVKQQPRLKKPVAFANT
jgi:hypothetical protein